MLHFDLNKSILTRDPYDHIDSIEIFLCDIIARMAWGEVQFNENAEDNKEDQDEAAKETQRYKNSTWVLKANNLTQDSPKPGLISYRSYLDK